MTRRHSPPEAVFERAQRMAARLLAIAGTLLVLISLLLLVETGRFGGGEAPIYQAIACFWIMPAGVGAVLLGATISCWLQRQVRRGQAVVAILAGGAVAVGATSWLRRSDLVVTDSWLFLLPWWGCALLAGMLGACLWWPREL